MRLFNSYANIVRSVGANNMLHVWTLENAVQRVREDITALGYNYFPFMLVVLKIKLIGTNGGREC